MAEDNVDDGSAPVRRQRRVPGGRHHRHNIRLSNEQAGLISAAAEAAGMSVPNLLVETTLTALAGNGHLSVAERRALFGELLAVRRQLTAIGANVDQLGAANTTGQLPPEAAPTMHAVAAMVNRLDAALTSVEVLRQRRRRAS